MILLFLIKSYIQAVKYIFLYLQNKAFEAIYNFCIYYALYMYKYRLSKNIIVGKVLSYVVQNETL